MVTPGGEQRPILNNFYKSSSQFGPAELKRLVNLDIVDTLRDLADPGLPALPPLHCIFTKVRIFAPNIPNLRKAGDRHMENKPAQNIQDTFLNTVRKDKTPITIYLVSGVKLTGKIRSFDKYSVLLENNSQEQLIFKHAISTVVSNRSVLHTEHRPAVAHTGLGPSAVPSPTPTAATAEQR
jgi:host factor-I protein